MSNNPPSPLLMFDVVILIVSAGAFGGIAQFLFSLGKFYLVDNSPAALRWKHGEKALGWWLFIGAVLTDALIGIAGAFAVLFVIIEAGRFKPDGSPENQLFLFTLSVIAGYASLQLLPSITNTVAQQIEKLTGEHAQLKIQQDKSTDRVTAISRAQTALASTTTPPAERISAAQGLAALQLPNDRTVAILQGRLYRANAQHGPPAESAAQYSKAIEVLNAFLQAKASARDDDYADALYNRSCYQCLRNGPGDLEQSLEGLTEAIKIKTSLKAYASSDLDFDNIRHDPQLKPQFTKLIT